VDDESCRREPGISATLLNKPTLLSGSDFLRWLRATTPGCSPLRVWPWNWSARHHKMALRPIGSHSG